MGFWSKFMKALNVGAKVAEVAAPVVAIKDPKLGAVVGQIGHVVEVATEAQAEQPKVEEPKR